MARGRSKGSRHRTAPPGGTQPPEAGRPRARFGLALAGAALLAAAGVAAWIALERGAATDGAAARNVLLISVDTLRADRLGAYGYDRPTSPRMDALARQGILFTQAICQNTNTNPSHASILTGLYPRRHGNWDNFFMMDADVLLASEVFKSRGYRTAAFVSGYTLKEKICGLDQGFDVYDDDFAGRERRGGETTDRALAWLADNGSARFFLFVHLFDPHGPYDPPAGEDLAAFPPREPAQVVPLERIPRYQRLPPGAPDDQVWTDLERYKARYDAEIAYADRQVGRLLDALAEQGLDGETVVILTSDHGEALDERGHLLDHGGGIGDEEIRVPLIIRLPDGRHAGRSFHGQVASLDLAPTMAAAAGAPWPGEAQGRDLLALVEAGGDVHPDVLVETRLIPARWTHRPYTLARGQTLKAVRRPDAKLVIFPGVPRNFLELYDLEADPGETVDVLGQRPDLAGDLIDRLNAFLAEPARRNSIADPALDDETREIFRTLGYVD